MNDREVKEDIIDGYNIEYFEKLRDVVVRQCPPDIEEAAKLIEVLEVGAKVSKRVVLSLLETRDAKIAELTAKLYPTHEADEE